VYAIESKRGKRFGDLGKVLMMDDGQTVIADKSNKKLIVL